MNAYVKGSYSQTEGQRHCVIVMASDEGVGFSDFLTCLHHQAVTWDPSNKQMMAAVEARKAALLKKGQVTKARRAQRAADKEAAGGASAAAMDAPAATPTAAAAATATAAAAMEGDDVCDGASDRDTDWEEAPWVGEDGEGAGAEGEGTEAMEGSAEA